MPFPPKIDPATFDWQPFLQHRVLPEPGALSQAIRSSLAGKRILITGAGGCIGSALARWITRLAPQKLLLLDSSEGALYDVHQALAELKGAPSHLPILASVCDSAAISDLFDQHRPQVVFHAAAFKHVPLMENNPFAVVTNNVVGARLLSAAAARYGCEQMLMVSTDKAVDPSSIMGASKRIAELILLAPHRDAVCRKVVRLGNVLGSSGSVVPLFLRQIAQGGPVTVSHREARRYLMTLTEAVDTLLCALSSNIPAGLLVPPLADPVRILDLAKYLVSRSAPEDGTSIVFTGLRPGDKMEESLISQRESYRNIPNSPLREVDTPTLSPDRLSIALAELRSACRQRKLPALLDAVQRLVPEYQPSAQLREHLNATATVTP